MIGLRCSKIALVGCVILLGSTGCQDFEGTALETSHIAQALECRHDGGIFVEDAGSSHPEYPDEVNEYLELPAGVVLDDVVLGATGSLLAFGASDVSSGVVVGMGTSGVSLAANADVDDVYSVGPLVVGDNTVRNAGSYLRSEGSVAVGANVDLSNIEQNTSFDPRQSTGFFALDPLGGASGAIEPGDSATLLPGSYGYVQVNGTLTLRSGVYDFQQLTLNTGSELRLDQENGPIVIYVNMPGNLSGATTVISGGGEPHWLMVYMGTDWFHVNSPVNMFIVAPNAQLNFNHAGPHRGTFWGGDVRINPPATFEHRPLVVSEYMD